MATLRLVPVSGGNAIEITKDTTVLGREPSVDVVVSDGSVSRRHARIELRNGAPFVVDQGSANGTFVDSARVAEQELKDGQTLRLGAVDFKVEFEEDLAATIAMPSEAVRPPAPPPAAPPAPAAPPPAPPVAAPPPPPPVAAPPPPPAPAPPPPRAAAPPPPPPSRPAAPPPAARVSPAGPASGSPVPQMGAGAPPPAKKGKGPVFWGFMGCCGCLLLAGLVAGGFFGFVFVATQAPVTAVQEMLKELKAGQTEAAYQRLSTAYRARLDAGDFARVVAAHPGLHANKDASFSSRKIENGRAILKDVVLTPESGESETASFELIEEGGAWKIDAMSFGVGGDPGTSSGGDAGSPGALQVTIADVTKTRESDSYKVVIDVTVSGYTVRPRDGGDFEMDLQEDVETLGPDGQRIDGLSKDEIERRQSATSESSPPPSQTFSTTLTVDPNNSPGLYTVRCTVIDHIGGGRQTQVANFSLP